MTDVAIFAPDPASGEMKPATVPKEDLAAALAAGAREDTETADEKALGGGLGQAASFAFGAGRMASGGLMDQALISGAGLAGGDTWANDMRRGLNAAKEVNPYATMGGEAVGLFVGAGEGVMAAGSAVEAQAASRLGGGLLGKIGSGAARGAVENTAIGMTQHISEDALGDPDANGENVFASMGKDALIGAAFGGGLGALGHLGGALKMRFKPGPRSAGLLDEVAGVEGAGKALSEEAATQQNLVVDLQKAGATSEQAARMVDDVGSLVKAEMASGEQAARTVEDVGLLAKEETDIGESKGIIGSVAEAYIGARSGGNADMREALSKVFTNRAEHLSSLDTKVGEQALQIMAHGTDLMRAEERLNKINFVERPDQFAKLLDPSKIEAAADAAMLMTQKVDAVVSAFEQERLIGGEAVQVRRLRRALTSTYARQSGLVDAGTETARRTLLRDVYMDTYKLKQRVAEMAGFGKEILTPSESIFSKLHEELRLGLEDESVWGKAGAANREWNATFSQQLPRRNDFASRFGVNIDVAKGVPKPEVDFEKARSFLRNLSGNEAEDAALQGTKSAQAYTQGIRARLDAIQKYADMSAEDRAAFAEARDSAGKFDATFGDAKKQSTIAARIRKQSLEEQGHGLGGVLGLATDIITRPYTSMERLGALEATVKKVGSNIENAIKGVFGKINIKDEVERGVRSGIEATKETAATRSSGEIGKEIGNLRELAANPPAMQERVRKSLGDVSSFAPKIGSAAAVTAMRALTFLASEAPHGRADRSLMMTDPKVRYSGQELSVFETKRNAAFHPETVVAEMKAGKLNRDGIRTVKAVYPQLFASMQDTARQQLMELAQKGLLDRMPYQQKAAISTLLEVPADGTWEPDFMALMQSTKEPPAANKPAEGDRAPKGGGRRPIKMNVATYETEAQQIEGRTTHP